MLHLEERMTLEDCAEQPHGFGVAHLEVTAELALVHEDVRAARTEALHGNAQGHETLLQAVVLDLLEQCHGHIDGCHRKHIKLAKVTCLSHIANCVCRRVTDSV